MPQIISAEASAGRIAGIIDTKPTVADSPQAAMPGTAGIKGRVVFEDVSFSYEGAGGKEAIKNISFTAEPGQTIAFLGPTGSGKSTLVNLIPRFYDVTSGRITIDGTDIRDIPQNELRGMVYIALQESVLFSGTIKENIGFGGTDMPYDQLVAASRAAEADGFISAIPSGYDSHVARRGANFSGGQKQRLSIARAIAPKPHILILDDSTSAVDVATESRIQAALATMIPRTTRLIVAQRISTVLMADKIILLDKGEIVEMGNHQDLIARSPLYHGNFRVAAWWYYEGGYRMTASTSDTLAKVEPPKNKGRIKSLVRALHYLGLQKFRFILVIVLFLIGYCRFYFPVGNAWDCSQLVVRDNSSRATHASWSPLWPALPWLPLLRIMPGSGYWQVSRRMPCSGSGRTSLNIPRSYHCGFLTGSRLGNS